MPIYLPTSLAHRLPASRRVPVPCLPTYLPTTAYLCLLHLILLNAYDLSSRSMTLLAPFSSRRHKFTPQKPDIGTVPDRRSFCMKVFSSFVLLVIFQLATCFVPTKRHHGKAVTAPSTCPATAGARRGSPLAPVAAPSSTPSWSAATILRFPGADLDLPTFVALPKPAGRITARL